MAFVTNCYRPLTRTPEDALQILKEIENACGLSFTCLVNNANLGSETTVDTLLDSLAYVEKLSTISGLPIWLHTAESSIAQALPETVKPVLPLHLQEKYFALPSQKPQNRPLWG